MKKWDVVLIIIIIAASIAAYAVFKLQSTEGSCAVITIDGADYMTLPLNKDITLRIPETGVDYNTITIKDGAVSVSDANCPDKICVNHSPISKTGETIVCLPHRLSIRITGENDSKDTIDGTAY